MNCRCEDLVKRIDQLETNINSLLEDVRLQEKLINIQMDSMTSIQEAFVQGEIRCHWLISDKK
jgi:hypothetical protein